MSASHIAYSVSTKAKNSAGEPAIEWGLSIHAESQRSDEVRNVVVDFGYTPETLLNNLAIPKIDEVIE